MRLLLVDLILVLIGMRWTRLILIMVLRCRGTRLLVGLGKVRLLIAGSIGRMGWLMHVVALNGVSGVGGLRAVGGLMGTRVIRSLLVGHFTLNSYSFLLTEQSAL